MATLRHIIPPLIKKRIAFQHIPPLCKRCKYFNQESGTCNLFLTADYTKNELASNARLDESLCGLMGKYFSFNYFVNIKD